MIEHKERILDILQEAEKNDLKLFVKDGELKFKYEENKEIKREIIQLLKENKSDITSFLLNHNLNLNDKSNIEVPSIVKVKRRGVVPMSFSQERLWFIDKLHGSVQYHEPRVLRIKGRLSVDTLKSSIESVLLRHESLRTVFKEKDGIGYQFIQKNNSFSITEIDLPLLKGNKTIEDVIKEEVSYPFDLSSDYMLRCSVVKLSEEEYILVLVLHHIASDGWSLPILVRELTGYYNSLLLGEEMIFPELPVQYSDYSIWQREYLSGDILEKKLQYWEAQLLGSEPLALPTDYDRPLIQSTEGSSYVFTISEEATRGLKELSRTSGNTLFMVLLSVYKVLLYRYTGQGDICVGTPIANRGQSEVASLIGFFVNTIVLRSRLEGGQSFKSLLEDIRTMTLSAYDHQDVPFEKVVDRLVKTRDQSNTPLFQTMFIFQNNESIADFSLGDASVEMMDIVQDTSKFDLSLSVVNNSNSLVISMDYSTSLFKEDTIIRFSEHFKALISSVIADPMKSIGKLDMLNELEVSELLVDFNDTSVAYPRDKTILDLFRDQVASNPNRVALVFEDKEMSYGELDERSNQLAHYLLDQGIDKEALIPICLDRGFDMVVSILGIMKSGGAYVPLDPNYPEDRVDFILEDTGAGLVLIDAGKEFLFKKDNLLVVSLDGLGEGLCNQPKTLPKDIVTPDQLAYVIYTSGSTGNPKGVMVEYKALFNYILWSHSNYVKKELPVFPLYTSLAFDLTITSIFTPLICGGLIKIYSNKDFHSELVDIIKDDTNDFIKLTPSHLKLFLFSNTSKKVEFVKKDFIVGGEQLESQLANSLHELLEEDSVIWNEYGPTEATVGCVKYKYVASGRSTVPIGKPVTNTQIYILNSELGLQPIGVIGELCIGGVQVARGYLNREELTRDKFIENPFKEGDRLYKTGDFARWLPDGNIEFIGRKDHQVKIRGYRIELGEIENALVELQEVTQAVVLALEDDQGSKRLVSYIVCAEYFDQDLIKESLGKKLPSYMVPDLYVFLDNLPLTSNGKIDRKALPDPDVTGLITEYVAPLTDRERILVEIWEDLLGVEGIGVSNNFFELGGDSIKAIQMVSRSKNKDLHFSVKDLFSYQTIRDLSSNIKDPVFIDSEVGLLEGGLELLPIQQEFFAKDYQKANHYNQSVLLDIDKGIDAGDLSMALEMLVTHHDSLRLQFGSREESVLQEYGSTSGSLIIIQLSRLSDINDLCDYYQGDLDIESGDICRFVLLETTNEERFNRLLLVVHHLGIDGVSWRILLEDLQLLLEGFSSGIVPELPVKQSSYRQWVSALKGYANDEDLLEEFPYWSSILSSVSEFAHDTAYSGNSSYGDVSSYRTVLDKDRTSVLLHGAHKAYGTEINDLLLSALALSLTNWLDSDQVVIGLEGHGREDLFPSIDVSRTVGWFTSLFPVLLEASTGSDIGSVIANTKDMLRGIPDKGIGYGVLRYLSESEEVRSVLSQDFDSILFNYLGGFDNSVKAEGGLGFSSESRGRDIAGSNAILSVLTINSFIVDGELCMDWDYDSNRYMEITIVDLAEQYMTFLDAILSHCESLDSRVFTSSDYGLPQSVVYESLCSFTSSPVHKGVIEDIYPLSPLQEGILFHSLYDTDSPSYLVQFSCDLVGGLDVSIFLESWNHLCNQHTVLRTGFHSNYFDIAVQCVYESVEIPIEELDYRSMSDSEQSEALSLLLASDRNKGFVLEDAPLWRITLIHLRDDCTKLVFTNHHILWDGWSFSQMMSSFMSAYKRLSEGIELPVIHLDAYKDQIRHLGSQSLLKGKRYWRDYLSEVEEPSYLPFSNTNISQGMEMTNRDKVFVLDKKITDKLLVYTQSERITINTLLQGCWSYLLSVYTGRKDVVFGATVSGRDSSILGIEHKVGLYINTLPVCTQIDSNIKVSIWLQDLQHGHTIGREEFSYVPLAMIQSDQGIIGSLFDSLLIFENYPVDEAVLSSEGFLGLENIVSDEQINYTLGITFYKTSDGLSVKLQYNDSVLSSAVVDMIQGHLLVVLESIVNGVEYIKDLEYLTDIEKQQLLLDFNDTSVAYPSDKTVLDLFRDQVASNPNGVALVFEESEMSYVELDERSNQLAHYLQDQGIDKETLVPICLDRGFDMMISILGVMKSGGAYVPIDPNYPEDRIDFMLGDTGAGLVLTDAGKEYLFKADSLLVVSLSNLEEDLWNQPKTLPKDIVTPDQLAYVIYTSGSTGVPKGVMIEHSALFNFIKSMEESLMIDSSIQLLSVTNFTFDISVLEMFLPLSVGGEVILCSQETSIDPILLSAYIDKKKPSHIQATPSRWQILLDGGWKNKDKVVLLSGGEAFPERLKSGMLNAGNEFIWNLYGPTETTIWSTIKKLPLNERVKIGTPIANTQIYILNGDLELLPIGVVGELYIGGSGLGRGYLNRTELTQEKFIDNPFLEDGRMYQTGDLARWLPDGNIEFIGRKDNQLKVRGYRIELGEIENALVQLQEVTQAVVLAREDDQDSKRLVGYIVCSGDFDPESIQENLSKKLPNYMVPGLYMEMDNFPLTNSGKIDRKALPDPDITALLKEYVAPSTDTERILVEIWEELLGVEGIGVKDDFFELGGYSLLAMKLKTKVSISFEVDVDIRKIFEIKVLKNYAQFLELLIRRQEAERNLNNEYEVHTL
ncbi:amino acid adenylation domain-containing protein [Aquimarina sp. 2201CG1-2-11]|uniref:amino acid adenylation domain-containing protein n=1 Tax=Aquimarina discodermiae TaxID=3231043 RepID=UPI00346329AD